MCCTAVEKVLKGLFDLTFPDTRTNLKGDDVLIVGKQRILRRTKELTVVRKVEEDVTKWTDRINERWEY